MDLYSEKTGAVIIQAAKIIA